MAIVSANDGKIRLATFLHPRFRFCCVPADVSRHFSARTSHTSGLRSIQTEILNFPVNIK